MARGGYLTGILKGIVNVFAGGTAVLDEQLQAAHREEVSLLARAGDTATIEVDPRALRDVRISYAPSRDGDPDAGEVVWTWVPYEEDPSQGKDRPVLVVARQSADRVLAVKLTSRAHTGDREYLAIGSGGWDAQRRPSWVDLDQVYSVHAQGMRREAAELDLDRFTRVALELQRRYGWRA